MAKLLEIRNLKTQFGPSGNLVTAVDAIDLHVDQGEIVAVIGANGAGKSTLLRTIAGVKAYEHGRVSFQGSALPRQSHQVVRKGVTLVPEGRRIFAELTVRENLLVYGRYFGLPRAVIRERSAMLLDFVQLSDRAGDQVEPLSGGMKRRLVIARSLINEPDILLLDEPTTGLDPQARHIVWDRLFRLKQRGVTLILTTHYMDEAEQLCDRLVVMDGGRIAAEGSPRALIQRYSTPEVLELRFDPGDHEQAAEKLRGLPAERLEVLADRVLIYITNGDEALAAVRGLGLEPLTSLVRRSTLEDVFLQLTGRHLDD